MTSSRSATASRGTSARPCCRRGLAWDAPNDAERRRIPRAGHTATQHRSTWPARPLGAPLPDAHSCSLWPVKAPLAVLRNATILAWAVAEWRTSAAMLCWTTATAGATTPSAGTSGTCTARRPWAALPLPPAGVGMMPYSPMIIILVVGTLATARAAASGASSRRSLLPRLGRIPTSASPPCPREFARRTPRCTPRMRPAAGHLTLLGPLSGDC